MKKLLMKWFPNWFHVCQHYEVDFEKYDRDSALDVEIIDDNTPMIHRALGISDEHVKELYKRCKIALIETESLVGAIEKVTQTAKHANEQVFMVHCLTIMTTPMAGLGGIIAQALGKDE